MCTYIKSIWLKCYMYLSVGWSCDGLTFPLSLGSWEYSFDTSVSFRDIENQNGDYNNGMGLQIEDRGYIEDNWILKKYG